MTPATLPDPLADKPEVTAPEGTASRENAPQGTAPQAHPRAVMLLLNIAHGIDHMFLLIFAAAVTTIAAEFGFARWEDLMPYGVAAFFLFGIGSLPAGRLGDMWGRRRMMLLFFFGIGGAAILCALTQNAWQLAAGLALIGAFAAIYHPVGIPMIVQNAPNPGAVIGVNGLAGNLGVALAALITGLLIKSIGWRAAFALPGVIAIVCGFIFMRMCPHETEAPAKRRGRAAVALNPAQLARAFAVMTAAAVTGSLLFNFTTNGNAQLLSERFRNIVEDPALLGAMLAAIYALASLAQVVVGRLIDRVSLKPLYLCIALAQIPLLMWASVAQGWGLFAALVGAMIFIFGAIPFTDAMIVRYVDDRSRSRVAGMRLTVSFGISSLAVWLLGPAVKQMGFTTLLGVMAAIAACTAAMVMLLPTEPAKVEVAKAAG
ncbi:MFS transporter [Alcaligenaceae bacterium B3P038]|nr:MFS transporter [Alcaligenaceae bacterium B3P038]